jgi:hypothetical protein
MHLEDLELLEHLDSLELAKEISVVVVPYACSMQLQSLNVILRSGSNSS